MLIGVCTVGAWLTALPAPTMAAGPVGALPRINDEKPLPLNSVRGSRASLRSRRGRPLVDGWELAHRQRPIMDLFLMDA
jgi:hypothetical protein